MMATPFGSGAGGGHEHQDERRGTRLRTGGVVMNVTFFPDQWGQTMTPASKTLEELRTLILETTARTKDKLPFLKLATFGDKRSPPKKNGRGGKCLRNDDNVVEITGIELDYDGKVMPFENAIAIVEQARLHALLYIFEGALGFFKEYRRGPYLFI
jgi:hypothetical protein